jgi:hypothetical protein
MPPKYRVAIIGSFKQHYEEVCAARSVFIAADFTVSSPLGAEILEEGIPFVRFSTDDSRLDDATVQTVALHRILGAHFVYVVAPNGYVGRTTCYEIGRALQAGTPIIFSEPPADLPLRVPIDRILSPKQVVSAVGAGEMDFCAVFSLRRDEYEELEDDLVKGIFARF